MVRRITPGLIRNPGQSVRIIHLPITGLIRRPTGIDSRMPGVAIVVDVTPVSVIIKIVNTGDIVRNIVVTVVAAGGIVVVRIVQVSVVAAIAPVVFPRITRTEVIIQVGARLIVIYARHSGGGSLLT